jgi:glycosyltransferase involved in cell wall biosynthesis
LKFDLVQGTTYTALAFLAFPIPVVSHFGSTTWGFLDAVPQAKDLDASSQKIWSALKKAGVIHQLNIATRKPLRDVAEIEKFVATRADAVIATSKIVRQNLLNVGVDDAKIHLVPNAIEDYWFNRKPLHISGRPALVFLGRLGSDSFTLKLKGVDRLIDLYQRFRAIPKHTIGITTNKALTEWLDGAFPQHLFYANLKKEEIPDLLRKLTGSILLITSRYEGFSLSLVEGMSQGLIPVAYPVGIAPEIITNGKNGFLVSNQTEAARAISYILGLTDDQRLLLAEASRATAKRFNSRMISTQLLAVYKKVLRNAPHTK